MNEKIKEFINEAARRYEADVPPVMIRLYYDRAMEIFAELIMKDCVKSCEEVKDEYLKQGRSAQEEAFLVAAVDDCISNIKNRFGVE